MAAKYDRIAADLRGKIADGRYRAGERLPTETSLMTDYGVSLATMRRALTLLESEGVIDRRHGTGTFVQLQRPKLYRTTDRYQWEKDRVPLSDDERRGAGASEYDSGVVVTDLVFSADYDVMAADEKLAALFDVPAGEPLLRRLYLTRKAGERGCLGIGTSYLVRKVIEPNPRLLDSSNEPWPGGTQHQLSTVGIELDRITDQVTARPGTAAEAELLDVRPGVPVMALRKVSISIGEEVVEVADIVWPGDRVELAYTTSLTRWDSR